MVYVLIIVVVLGIYILACLVSSIFNTLQRLGCIMSSGVKTFVGGDNVFEKFLLQLIATAAVIAGCAWGLQVLYDWSFLETVIQVCVVTSVILAAVILIKIIFWGSKWTK